MSDIETMNWFVFTSETLAEQIPTGYQVHPSPLYPTEITDEEERLGYETVYIRDEIPRNAFSPWIFIETYSQAVGMSLNQEQVVIKVYSPVIKRNVYSIRNRSTSRPSGQEGSPNPERWQYIE